MRSRGGKILPVCKRACRLTRSTTRLTLPFQLIAVRRFAFSRITTRLVISCRAALKNSGVYVWRVVNALRGATRSFSIIPATPARPRASRLASWKTRLDRWNLNVTGGQRLLFAYRFHYTSPIAISHCFRTESRKSRETFDLFFFFRSRDGMPFIRTCLGEKTRYLLESVDSD